MQIFQQDSLPLLTEKKSINIEKSFESWNTIEKTLLLKLLLKETYNLYFLNVKVKYCKLEPLKRQNFSVQILIWLWEVLGNTHCF